MELSDAQIDHGLHSPDPGRQDIAEGVDISRFANDITKIFPHRNVRKLGYEILKSCRQSIREWENVSNVLMQDLVASDVELRIAATRMLTYLPRASVKEVLAGCEPLILQSLSHQDPHVRAEATDALVPMLLPPAVDQLWQAAHVFVKDAWKGIAKMATDIDAQPAGAAFRAVRALLAPFGMTTPNLMELGVAQRTIYSLVVEMLTPKLPELCARFIALPTEQYSACPAVLAYLSVVIREGEVAYDDGISPLDDSHPAVKRATPLITNYLLPLLASDSKPAVVEAGHAVLAMTEKFRNDLGHRPWRMAVAEAFLAVLQTEDGQHFSDIIIEDVAKIAGKVDPVSCLDLTKRILLVAGTCANPDTRARVLIRVCFALHSEGVARRAEIMKENSSAGLMGPSKIISPAQRAVIEDGSVIASETMYREEVAYALCESLLMVRRKEAGAHQSAWFHEAVELLDRLFKCLAWNCNGRSFAQEGYLTLLSEVCSVYADARQRNEPPEWGDALQNVLEKLLDLNHRVPTAGTRVRLMFLLCCYIELDGMDYMVRGITLMALLKRRLRIQDSTEVRAQSLAAVRKRGLMGTYDVEDVDESAHMEIALLCALHLGVRCNSIQLELTDLLDDISKHSSQDAPIREACRSVQARIKSVHSIPPANTVDSTNDHPPPGMPPPPPDAFAMLGATALNKVLAVPFANAVAVIERGAPASAFVPINSNEPEPILVSGASDPLHITCRHTSVPAERAVVLHVHVANITDIEITGIQIHMGVMGVLELDIGQSLAVQDIDGLFPQEGVEFEQRFTISAFGTGSIVFQVTVEGAELPLRCGAYTLPFYELMVPARISHTVFLDQWQRLTYSLSISGTLSSFATPTTLMTALKKAPFAVLSERTYGGGNYFLASAAAETCFNDTVGLTITAANDHRSAVAGGSFNKPVWNVSIALRSSTAESLAGFTSNLQQWVNDTFGGTVVIRPESENVLNSTTDTLLPANQQQADSSFVMNSWKELVSSRSIPAAAVLSSSS